MTDPTRASSPSKKSRSEGMFNLRVSDKEQKKSIKSYKNTDDPVQAA